MRWWFALMIFLALAGGSPAALGSASAAEEFGVDEESLAAKARRGRLSQDELIKKGEDLSYFTRLKLYLYAKELEPYFEGVEDTFRDLARGDPADQAAVDNRRRAIYQALVLTRRRLMAAERDHPERDWRRGLAGLIWLDHEWRGRIYEQGKDEIKNPYDLVALVDCLDARLRGLEPGDFNQCPVRPAATKPKDKQDDERLPEHGERRNAPGD
ncbi:hypothetical protein AAU61_04380 [Desulfocarbo indianensis]|nr:hypothetical protein AAU61_04380 [Desulfocarbo indianensis]